MKTRFLYKGNTKDERSTAYIEKKLERLAKLVDGSTLFEIEISEAPEKTCRVEVMVSEHGELFRAEETTQSIEASIDAVTDELKDRLRSFATRKETSIYEASVH